MPEKPRAKPNRTSKAVGLWLGPEDEARFERWVQTIPEAEGNRSQALRIFLRRWDETQAKPRKS